MKYKKCKNCGKMFEINNLPNFVPFCSNCKNSFIAKMFVEEIKGVRYVPVHYFDIYNKTGTKLCRFCGKSIPARRISYCSNFCRNEINKFSFTYSRAVKLKINPKCEICGSEDVVVHHIIPVHHINKIYDLDLIWDIKNLITLCKYHHNIIHQKNNKKHNKNKKIKNKNYNRRNENEEITFLHN